MAEPFRHLALPSDRAGAARPLATALAVAIAYFLAARLGLALLTELEDVAVFWPASGIAAGLLISLGPRARAPVALGVLIATVAANLMGDRNVWAAVSFGLCNAVEALLTAYLIERWFGRDFGLDSLNRVLGFLAAAAFAAAIAAVGGAAAIALFQAAAPFPSIWRVWFLSDGLGIVTIAPLAIGLGQALHQSPPRRELAEGALVLALLGLLSVYTFAAPKGSWATFLPISMLFPLLLWIGARCRPVFAAGAVFIVTVTLVSTTTAGIGRFGDPTIPAYVRVHAAQFALIIAATCALILAALFEERRRHELALKISHESLDLALGGAELGAFSFDTTTGRLECDERAALMHGHQVPPATFKEGRRFIVADDLATINSAIADARRSGSPGKAEYRVLHPAGHPRAGEVRWVAFEFTILRNARGKPVRLLGVTRDITERRQAEERLRKQVAVEQHLLARISAGVPLVDVLHELIHALETQSDDGMMASILILDKQGRRLRHGAAPSLPKAYNDAIDGALIGPNAGSCGTAAYRGEPVIVTDVATDPLWCDYRDLARAHGLRACWSTPIKAVDGRVLGTFANYYREPRGPTRRDLDAIAITTHTAALAIERHLSEQALRESRDRLSSALNAAGMVGTWDWHIPSDTVYCDAQLAALCAVDPKVCEEGAPQATYFNTVHPDDVARIKAAIERAIATGEKYSEECRLVQKDGTVRWVIARGQCLYDSEGRATRFPGAVVDVTESKQAEFALKESEARLQQALAAGHVMAFEWSPRTGRSQRSDNTLQILGIELPQGDEGPANTFLAHVHPDDQLSFKEHVFGVCPDRPSYSVKFRFVRPDGRELWLEETAKAEFGASGRLLRLKGLTRDITDLKQAEEHKSLLIAELDHRVKNTLACVSAIAQRSREGSPSMDQFLEVLDGRIHSMANAHALLSRSRWQGVDLELLVDRVLAPCVGIGNAVVEGPRVILSAEATQSLAMVFHELVTNAAKYGALSRPNGSVTVRWDRRQLDRDAAPGLHLEWRERNGPPVVAPTRSGYGTSVIRDLVPYELGGLVDLEFAADGLQCRIEVPLKWICDDWANAAPDWVRPPASPGAEWPAAPPR